MAAYLRVSPRISAGTLARSNRAFLDGPVKTYYCDNCGGQLKIDDYNLWRCKRCAKSYSNEVTLGIPRPVYASGKPMEVTMIDKRNDQPVVDLWCKFCGWKGPSNEAGWTEDEGGEWTCPECGGGESICVTSATLDASDEDHAKALAFCGEQSDNERVARLAEAMAGAKQVDKWFALLYQPSAVLCYGCGKGNRTLNPCPDCGVLLCQDCEDIHVCDPDLADYNGKEE